MLEFLQTNPIRLDSLDFKSKVTEVAEIITTTPPNELLTNMIEKGIGFGLKVLSISSGPGLSNA